MADDYTIKRNDVGRTITGQFLDANNNAIDCSDSTARKVFMRPKGGGENIVNGALFSFTNEAEGEFIYAWAAGDVATAGLFELEFEATLPGGVVVTFPTSKRKPYLIVRIIEDLG